MAKAIGYHSLFIIITELFFKCPKKYICCWQKKKKARISWHYIFATTRKIFLIYKANKRKENKWSFFFFLFYCSAIKYRQKTNRLRGTTITSLFFPRFSNRCPPAQSPILSVGVNINKSYKKNS